MGSAAVTLNGACHCGAVQFRVRLNNGLDVARRCACSFCRMRGAITVTANAGDIEITKGEKALTLYQFNTKVAKHYFCSVCGIYTHHQRRFNPELYGINVACLEGISPFDFDEVQVIKYSPDDMTGSTASVDGILKFIRCE